MSIALPRVAGLAYVATMRWRRIETLAAGGRKKRRTQPWRAGKK
jgi:hypothetical protein